MKFFALFGLFFAGATALASAEWNHVTCFYRTAGENTHLHYEQHSSRNFSFEFGDSHLLTSAWTTKRTDFNTGICAKMLSVGKDDTAYVIHYTYKADVIRWIDENCGVQGTNVQVVAENKQLVQRGQFISYSVPWHGGFDTATVVEYIPKVDELENLKDVAAAKCQEFLQKK